MIPMLVTVGCGTGDPDRRVGHTHASDPHAGMDMATPTAVEVAPEVVAVLGIRTEPAESGAAGITRRAPATVGWDPLEVTHITAQPGGQVRSLALPRPGERVRAGQVVARLYQPDVRAAFEELRVAHGLGEPWRSAARARLLASGVSPADLDAAARGETPELYAVRAPAPGVVLERTAVEGSWIGPGGVLGVVGDPRDLVVEMVVTGAPPEADARVRLEDPATGGAWDAVVASVLPTAGPAGLRVRLIPEREIAVGRPLVAEWTDTVREGVWVPSTALVDTGRRRVVFVETARGRFEPRAVQVGARADDRVQITHGLAAGEPVVVSGTFLLDSETQIGAAGHAGHGS